MRAAFRGPAERTGWRCRRLPEYGPGHFGDLHAAAVAFILSDYHHVATRAGISPVRGPSNGMPRRVLRIEIGIPPPTPAQFGQGTWSGASRAAPCGPRVGADSDPVHGPCNPTLCRRELPRRRG
jgi:hypothetical protein